MAFLPVRLALRRSLREVRHVRPVPAAAATGVVRAVYDQVERDFGILAPPVALHSPAPPVLAAAWAMLRESLVATGAASRGDKELVAAAVSTANTCPYCVEVHGMALESLGRGVEAAALATGGPGVATLSGWAAGATVDLGRAPAEIAELVGVAVCFHYLNRVVTVFLRESPLPASVPDSARGAVRGVLARVLRPVDASPGASLDLLPPAPGTVPGWALAAPVLAEAFARAYAAIDAAAEDVVGPGVRQALATALSTWDGTPPGISRSWVAPLVSGLSEKDRPAARLALVTALAPAQVDDGLVAGVLGAVPGDAAVVTLVAWAALGAARVWGDRLAAAGAAGVEPAR